MTLTSEVSAHVEEWLRGEHVYQFAKFDAMYGDELRERRKFIADSEMPNKWHRSIILRNGGAHALADQQVLKVCAASRAVVVYDACLSGTDRHVASEATYDVLHKYFATITEVDVSEEDLFQPFEVAFPSLIPAERFQRAGLLALTGLMYSEKIVGSFRLPSPGLPSGQL